VNRDLPLPVPAAPPLLREHRLYQADWLLRFYHYTAAEILDSSEPFLDEYLDPKAAWALRHPDFFPLEVNRADYRELLRVPGVGVKSALRIIKARRQAALEFYHLKAMGVVLKRAGQFLLCRGRAMEPRTADPVILRHRLISGEMPGPVQLELFS